MKKAIEYNHLLYQPSQKPKQREVFFKEIRKGYGFKKAVKRCYTKKYLKDIVKTLLYEMKFRGGVKPLSDNCYYAYKGQYRLNVSNIEEVCIRLCSENKFEKTVKCLVLHKLKYSVLESGIRLAC